MIDSGAASGPMPAILSGDPVIMDGAMGTELDRRGTSIASTDWVDSTLGAPLDLAAIHQSYAEAGAQLHIANTFATARHVLSEVGLGDRFEQINRDAVAHCRQAIERSERARCWIAGSISTYMIGSDRGRLPPAGELEANARDQAAILADAGCEMIVLEMLHDVEISCCLMRAAASTGLPVSVGLTVVFDEEGGVVLRGLKTGASDGHIGLEVALPRILLNMKDDYPWILTIMHSDLAETDTAVKLVRERWAGPMGVYPNSGKLADDHRWDHRAVCTTDEYVLHAKAWIDQGAGFVGGCCGIGPDHIRALASALKVA